MCTKSSMIQVSVDGNRVWVGLGVLVLLGAAGSRECVGMRGEKNGHRFAVQVLQTCGEYFVA